MTLRLKKDDTVMVLRGKDKGRKGKIIRILAEANKAVVERMNVAKKHKRPTRAFQGGIIEEPLPLPMSALMLVCPKCSKPTRLKSDVVSDKRVRICKSCKEIIDKV